MLLKKRYGDKIPLTAEELGRQAGEVLEELFMTRDIRLMPDAQKAILFFCVFKESVCLKNLTDDIPVKNLFFLNKSEVNLL